MRFLILFFMAFLLLPALSFAAELKIDLFNPEGILGDIDRMATSLITTIRVIVIIVTTLLAISIGLTLLTAKDGYVLEQVKTRIIFLLAGLSLVFMTEPLVRFILSIVG